MDKSKPPKGHRNATQLLKQIAQVPKDKVTKAEKAKRRKKK